jgi:hypothetical protein
MAVPGRAGTLSGMDRQNNPLDGKNANRAPTYSGGLMAGAVPLA